MSENRLQVLFVCTGNACRSQMAEGFARHLKGDLIEPFSAGIVASGLDPTVVEVMNEIGVDISGRRSKTLNEFLGREFDYVVTVCDYANEQCPYFPGKTKRVHVGFDDPPSLAQTAPTNEAALNIYRRVRDEIKAFVEQMPSILEEKASV